MTCASRIRQLRMMERMERLSQSSDRVEKTKDGTMKYYDHKGNVLVEAKMVERSER